MELLNPKEYGLNPRTKIESLGNMHVGIVKRIKSRIIMKDGAKILEQVKQIQLKDLNYKVSLIISGPICSKTRHFLNENGVEIIEN